MNLGYRWRATSTQVGKGGNGIVIEVIDTQGEHEHTLAAKVLQKLDRYDRFKREVEVLASLDHPNLCTVIDYHLPNSPDRTVPPFFIMPFYKNKSIRHFLEERLPELGEVNSWLSQIVDTLCYLHTQGTSHRDIKPSNLLVDDDKNIILCDFGLVFKEDDTDRLTADREQIGSTGYIAPEMLNGPHDANAMQPADIYSLGMTIWALSAGKQPRLNGDDLGMPENNLTNVRGPEWLDIQDIVSLCTYTTPKKRPTIKEIIEIISTKPISIKSNPLTGTETETITKQLTKFSKNHPTNALNRKVAQQKNAREIELKKFHDEFLARCKKDVTLMILAQECGVQSHSNYDDSKNSYVDKFSYRDPGAGINLTLFFIMKTLDNGEIWFRTAISTEHRIFVPIAYTNIQFAGRFIDTTKRQILNCIPRQMNLLVKELGKKIGI